MCKNMADSTDNCTRMYNHATVTLSQTAAKFTFLMKMMASLRVNSQRDIVVPMKLGAT